MKKTERFFSLSAVLAVIAAVVSGCCCCAETVKDSKTDFAAKAVGKYLKSGELPGIISVFTFPH